jgi:hypothetical protein
VEEVNTSRWQHDGCGKEDFYSDVWITFNCDF